MQLSLCSLQSLLFSARSWLSTDINDDDQKSKATISSRSRFRVLSEYARDVTVHCLIVPEASLRPRDPCGGPEHAFTHYN
ncbi:hypothetical protein CC2G_011933 [Coprinopsis cinerea AmutBmut pab1-1]|nr:hypothetical protein CC2G_011933 [Coprinopsis cinerea AmutBmut pab1-1]